MSNRKGPNEDEHQKRNGREPKWQEPLDRHRGTEKGKQEETPQAGQTGINTTERLIRSNTPQEPPIRGGYFYFIIY